MIPRYDYQADSYDLVHARTTTWVCRECDQEKEMFEDHIPGECECGGTFYKSTIYLNGREVSEDHANAQRLQFADAVIDQLRKVKANAHR